jgi:hypothetical protein
MKINCKINHTIKRFLTLTLLALSVNANSVFEYGNTADYKTNPYLFSLKNPAEFHRVWI